MHHSIRRFGVLGIAITIALMLVLLGMTQLPAILAEPAASPTPILLIVDDNGPSRFGRYLGEILRAEGLNSFDVVDIGALTPVTLTQYDIAILAYTTLTGTKPAMLANYVASGGRLLAVRPDPQISDLFGLTTLAGTLTNGYLKIDGSATISGTAPGQGLYTSTLQIHGTSDEYNTAAGTVTIAQLYSDAATATAYPAAVIPSSGQTAAFTYDLAQNIVYTRQGNPANANMDIDHDGLTRTIDLFQTASGAPWVDRDKIQIPQADEQQRLFARLVQQLMANAHPMPQLWYFPGNAKTMLILTGDAHGNPPSYYEDEIASLNSHGGKITLYLSIGSSPDPATLDSWRAVGHDFGVHPYVYHPDSDPLYSSTNLTEGYTASDNWWTATYPSDPKSPTVRNHQIAWQGWTDAADIAAIHGIALDTDFYTWGNWLQKPDGTWAYGYINGSGQPMQFARADGSLVPNYQLGTGLIDEQLLCISSNECLNDTQALAISQQLINSSLAGDYAALVTQFHVDYYATSRVWAEATMDYARSQNVPMWNANQWLTFVETRHAADYTNFTWDSTTGLLTFNLSAPATSGITLTTMLPGMYGARGLQSVAVDGISKTLSAQAIKGVSMAFVSVPAGNHSFSASYQTGVVFPTPTFTPTLTGPDIPTALSNDTLTQTTYIDFGQGCAVLTNTHVSDIGDGAVVLAGAFADDFDGAGLNASRWTSGTWSGGGAYYSATVSGGVVTLPDNGWIRSTSTYTHGVMEAVAQFSNGAWQHLGLASDGFINDRYFIFSTKDTTSTLYARANNNSGEQTVDLGAIPSGMHRYRIEWGVSTAGPTTDTVRFYIDSALQATFDVTNAGLSNLYLYLTNNGTLGVPLAVDQAQVTPPYLTSGTYTSCVFDAGASNAWQKISWDAALTTTNSLTVQVRTSLDNSTWSAWNPALSSGSAISPMQRYVQYQLILNTGDSQTTPQVNWVALGLGPIADLAIAKTASPSPVMAGTGLTYTLVVTNYGPADASGLNILDTLSGDVSFITATMSAGSCGPLGGIISCTLSLLPTNSHVTATILVSVSAQAVGPLVNSAQATADTADPDPSNNIATVSVPVNETLNVTRTGSGFGSVSSNPAGIACGSTCTAIFNYNAAVTLTAVASTGWTFTGWSGSGCSGTGSCTVTMNAVRTVTATFVTKIYLPLLSNHQVSTADMIEDHLIDTSNNP